VIEEAGQVLDGLWLIQVVPLLRGMYAKPAELSVYIERLDWRAMDCSPFLAVGDVFKASERPFRV
jgi:hypothetical protein